MQCPRGIAVKNQQRKVRAGNFDKEKKMFTDLCGKWQVYLDKEKRAELPAE